MATAGEIGVPPHPTPVPAGPGPAYSGHYYEGAVYDGATTTASRLSVDLRVPDDFPQGTDFYYVILSVWDNAGSYDQVGFTSDYGTWGVAYSTTSACAGTYYYSTDAYTLTRGETYGFAMSIAGGTVTFTVENATGSTVWSLGQTTGGTAFNLSGIYTCDSGGYYDYTDYEEVYSTAAPVPPYDLFFTANAEGAEKETNWSASTGLNSEAPTGVETLVSGANVTIANEPYTFAFTNGEDSVATGPSSAGETYYGNVSVVDLSPDTPIALSNYSVPSGWRFGYAPASGSPPFTSEYSFQLASTTAAGVYTIGLNASDGSGTYARLALSVTVPASDTYRVTFSQTGLPPGQEWWANVSGEPSVSSTGSTAAIVLPDGSYTYTIAAADRSYDAAGGSFEVEGTGFNVPVTFALVTYSVTFSETGLPSGTTWYVNVTGGTSHSSSGLSMVWEEPNGTYDYGVASADRSYAVAGGSFRVDGSAVDQPLVFALVTFAVTFTQSGLPGGEEWFVNITGEPSLDSTTGEITTALPNASYSYAVGTVDSAYAAPPGGFDVAGAPVDSPVDFGLRSYTVTFTQTGLPSGATWFVNITGESPLSSTGRSLSVSLANGSYDYAIGTPDKSYGAPDGSFTVRGASVPVSVQFSLVTFAATFTEEGLPASTPWWVNLSGEVSEGSSTTSITSELPNGSYSATLATSDKEYAASLAAPVLVDGSPTSVTVTFSLVTYAVTFSETGLPNGANWSVEVGGSVHVSVTSTIVVDEPNASYSYTVGTLASYQVSPSAGNVTVAGAGVAIPIVYSPRTGGNADPDLLYEEGAAVGGLVAAALVAAALVVGRRRRSRSPP